MLGNNIHMHVAHVQKCTYVYSIVSTYSIMSRAMSLLINDRMLKGMDIKGYRTLERIEVIDLTSIYSTFSKPAGKPKTDPPIKTNLKL